MSVLDITQTAANLSANPEEYVMEYQVESERGFHVLGSSVFSSNTLFAMDPAHFTSIQGEPLGTRLTDFEVPDDSWVWAWSRWYVDMSADVDDQGWCYSWRFRSKHWSSRHRLMRSFVRQRVWKRPRVKRSLIMHSWMPGGHHSGGKQTTKQKMVLQADGTKVDGPDGPNDDVVFAGETPNNRNDAADDRSSDTRHANELCKERAEVEEQRGQDIIKRLRGLRNDRERINEIIDYIENHPDDINLLVDIREQVLATLNFVVSKRTLVTKLSESSSQQCQLFILAPSNTWRDQVLRHGAPDTEVTEQQESDKDDVK